MQHGPRDAQLGGCLSDAEVGGAVKVCRRDVEGFLSEPLPIGPRACQPSADPLSDAGRFEFRQSSEYMKLQPSGRRRAVDPFAQLTKDTPTSWSSSRSVTQVPEVAPEPIQAPDHQDLEAAPPGVGDESIQGRSAIPRTGDTTVDVLHRLRPRPRPHVAPQLGELVLRLLVEGAHAGIQRRPS